jgi:hypothetical protein
LKASSKSCSSEQAGVERPSPMLHRCWHLRVSSSFLKASSEHYCTPPHQCGRFLAKLLPVLVCAHVPPFWFALQLLTSPVSCVMDALPLPLSTLADALPPCRCRWPPLRQMLCCRECHGRPRCGCLATGVSSLALWPPLW